MNSGRVMVKQAGRQPRTGFNEVRLCQNHCSFIRKILASNFFF